MKSSHLNLVIKILLFSALLFTTSFAQTITPQFKPTIITPKVEGGVKVDGYLDEPLWQQAGVADNFVENSPGDQTDPAVNSKVLVAYDDKNLYFALIAYDDPSEIRTSYRDRDNIFRDDYFGIMLDTYNDQSWGYELFTNPYGIQGDLRMQEGGGEDASFDIIWESMGIVTDSGYQVEIAIPFASLRFPDKDEHVWRVNFWRDRQRDARYRYTWAAQDRDNACFLCQWGYLKGITAIKPTGNLEILPNVTAFQSGERLNYSNPDSDFLNEDPDGELSLNVRYGVTSNSSVEATMNPDFSQVESDAAQIDVNTTFGLFFPETRPFFQEGGELFNTWINGVYTRSINDPEIAAKFTGQFGRTSVAYLFARDENSPIVVPLRQQASFSQADKSTSNIVRVRHGIMEDSYLGFLATDRRMDDFGDNDMHTGGSGTAFGFDSRFRLSKKYHIETQAMFSYTEEPIDAHPVIDYDDDSTAIVDNLVGGRNQELFDRDRRTIDLDGETFWGENFYLSLERHGRMWSFDIDYWATSPTFRADNGFVTSNDRRTVSAWTGVTFRPNRRFLITWEPSVSFGRTWTYHGNMNLGSYNDAAFDEWVRAEIWMNLIHQTDVSINYLNSQERFFGENFPGISIITLYMNSRPSEYINVGVRFNTGRGIWRNPYNPDLGVQKNFSTWGSLKPTERLYIIPEYEYQSMKRRDAYFNDPDHAGEPDKIYAASIFRTRLTYQFTRNLFLRLIVQYVDQTRYGYDEVETTPGDTVKVSNERVFRNVTVEPLLTYKINAYTKFYIGMNAGYDRYNPDSSENSLLEPTYALSNRQFYMKLQYLFRL